MTIHAVLAIRDAVASRRSIRRFAEHPVSCAEVEDILRLACWSPSPHNTQPWRFTVLFQACDKARLADAMANQLALELRQDGMDEEAIERQTGRSRMRITSAPVVILCSLHPEGLNRFGDSRRDELEWTMAVQSVGAVLQTVFLLAAERGLGTCWMAAPMYCPEVVRSTLALPADFQPQALVLMGYPDGPGRVRDRRAGVIDLR